MNILNHSQELKEILFCDTGQIHFINENEMLMAYIKQGENNIINLNKPLTYWKKQPNFDNHYKISYSTNRSYTKKIKSKKDLKEFYTQFNVVLNTDKREIIHNNNLEFDIDNFKYFIE